MVISVANVPLVSKIMEYDQGITAIQMKLEKDGLSSDERSKLEFQRDRLIRESQPFRDMAQHLSY